MSDRDIREIFGASGSLVIAFADLPVRIQWITRSGEVLKEETVSYSAASARPEAAHLQENDMNVSQAPMDAIPFVDTPLKAAIRCAFDNPTIANIEAVAQVARPEAAQLEPQLRVASDFIRKILFAVGEDGANREIWKDGDWVDVDELANVVIGQIEQFKYEAETAEAALANIREPQKARPEAAAPLELLHALKQLIAYYGNVGMWLDSAAVDVMNTARDAIAKAEGIAPLTGFNDLESQLWIGPVAMGRSPLPGEQLTDMLRVIAQCMDRCEVCGMENDSTHSQEPHAFEPTDIAALFQEELLGNGFRLVPINPKTEVAGGAIPAPRLSEHGINLIAEMERKQDEIIGHYDDGTSIRYAHILNVIKGRDQQLAAAESSRLTLREKIEQLPRFGLGYQMPKGFAEPLEKDDGPLLQRADVLALLPPGGEP